MLREPVRPPAEAVIRTEGLSKSYGRFPALRGLDLTVGRGEVFGFLGLNGAGKSTTIRLLCGLLRPSAGTVYIGGERLSWPDIRRVRRRIGYLPQSIRFQEAMDGWGVIRFYGHLSGVGEAACRERAGEMGIPLERRAAVMSPGQQRKLGLLLATLGDPELLFLDEPTAGLDPEGQREVRQIIGDWRSRGMTVFVSSHILGEVQHVCSSVGILHGGRLLYSGPVEERFESQARGFVPGRWPAGLPALEPLPPSNGTQRLLARVGKEQVPLLVSRLVGQEVDVYGVKEQSLEEMFALVVEGSERT